MIKERIVKLKLNSKTVNHYWKIGYMGKVNETIDVKVEDLTKGSHVKITSICDICGVENKITFKNYLKGVKNGSYYSCHRCCAGKKKNTWLNNLGVEHPAKSKIVRQKSEKTNMKKYGKRYYILTDEFLNDEDIINKRKKTRLDNGYDISEELLTKWELYKKECRKLTDQNKKKLFEQWDGYDYYDGEYIRYNYDKYNPRDSNYPSIDHKLSVKYGFENELSPLEISNIENLCITKTGINNSKNSMIEKDFKSIIQPIP